MAQPQVTDAGHRRYRHWRARLRLTFADDPRYEPPVTTHSYSAWVGAGSEQEARALLQACVADLEDLVGWELAELVEATEGDPEVIALWEGL
jgi:hypothetical protein